MQLSQNNKPNENDIALNNKDTSLCEDEALDNGTKNNFVTQYHNQNTITMPCLDREKRRDEPLACIACKNNDKPTGLYRCILCDKPVYLFGCSIAIPITEEGCGESRLCLECDADNTETNAVKNWKGKGKAQVPKSKSSRSASSYLSSQPRFDQIDLNKKGKVTPIALLKNGSSLKNKPVSVPEIGKVLLTNSCSPDSLFTIIACSAADSEDYRQFLLDRTKNDKTADFVLNIIDNKSKNKMYFDRVVFY